MTTVIPAVFTWPLGDDAALIARTPAYAPAHLALVEANYQRLAQWFPDAYQEPPTLAGVTTNLERAATAALDGSLLPLWIAVRAQGGWQLVGWAQLEIDTQARCAQVGYWLDADFVGRGLVTRTISALLDQAFGPLGLERVGLHAVIDNERSRAVAHRLGFTQEGILRECTNFTSGRRDLVIYGMLAREWNSAQRQALQSRDSGNLPTQGITTYVTEK